MPYWIWSSPVGDGENNDRCVIELGISVVPVATFLCGARGNVGIRYLVYLGFTLSICFPLWSVFFIGVCRGVVV